MNRSGGGAGLMQPRLAESSPWEWDSLYKGFSVGANLCTYRDLPKTYQGFGARDFCLLPWKPIRNFEDPSLHIFTGVPVTDKFSSFHWSPHNIQVFTGVPEILWASWTIYFDIIMITLAWDFQKNRLIKWCFSYCILEYFESFSPFLKARENMAKIEFCYRWASRPSMNAKQRPSGWGLHQCELLEDLTCKRVSVVYCERLLISRWSVRFRPKLICQTYMDMRYIDPQSRVLNYCWKWLEQSLLSWCLCDNVAAAATTSWVIVGLDCFLVLSEQRRATHFHVIETAGGHTANNSLHDACTRLIDVAFITS